PRKHARRGGLAMRARDGEDPFVAQHIFSKPLGTGIVRHAGIQQRLDRGVAAAQHVTDDDAVEILELPPVITLVQADAELAQLRAHRRVYVLIRTGYLMARGLRQRGDAAHERTAYSEDMN